MNRTLARFLSALAGLALIAGACADDLVIPGSGSPQYVLGELAKEFNARQSRHRVSIPASTGTSGALRDVEQGLTLVGRVGRPLTESELGRGLRYIALGRDAVVFVAGAAVSARSISLAQARDVYAGRITDWRELGAQPGPIRAIGREPTDSSRQALDRVIKGFAQLEFHADVKLVLFDPQVVELLDRYPTSLAFLNRSALFAAKSRINALALDGVEPTIDALASGRYPLWVEFGLVHKAGALGAAGQAFLAFIHSPSGERLLREHGVLPLPAAN
ncbi:MAG: substrate-binding domain-containing protein [Burkholderiaceae bacterium]